MMMEKHVGDAFHFLFISCLFLLQLLTESMYKTSECLEDLVQCLVSTHDENVPLASAPKCDWEVLEIMPILWWAYALIPHLERWDEKQQGELVFSAWNINSSCESGMQKFKLNVQYLCFCDIETTVHHHMFVTMFIIYDWIYKYM